MSNVFAYALVLVYLPSGDALLLCCARVISSALLFVAVPKKTIIGIVCVSGLPLVPYFLFLRFHFYRGIIFWARGRVSSSSSKTEN